VRVVPDDEVYRVNTVWLGPSGLTFPWTARYQAYGTWLAIFLSVLLVERITPLSVGIPPVWEICLTTLITYGAMGLVDHERPIGAVWQTFRADLSAPRSRQRVTRVRRRGRVRVRDRRPPGRRLRGRARDHHHDRRRFRRRDHPKDQHKDEHNGRDTDRKPRRRFHDRFHLRFHRKVRAARRAA